jgi:hypothetical protein
MWRDGHKFGYVDSIDYTWRKREGSGKDAFPCRLEDTERMNALIAEVKNNPVDIS